MLGSPLYSLSAQERYGYDFPAVNGESAATYNKGPNQVFMNMDNRSPHITWHESAHYLSVRQNRANLAPYIDLTSANQAFVAELDLLDRIRRYKGQLDESKDLMAMIRAGDVVSLDDVINEANFYPQEVWTDPNSFLQFRGRRPSPQELQQRADDELYAEFTAYLQAAQGSGLLRDRFEHPVYKIFSEVKAK